jgi:hypothetical protein
VKPLDLDTLNPGIRKTVAWLRSLGFETTDSGDGRTHEHACDRDEPYVVIRVEPEQLVEQARALDFFIRNRGIGVSPVGEGAPCLQASFDPVNDSCGNELDDGYCDSCADAAADQEPA